MMRKRGVELTMNVMIISILALVVLAILLFFLFRTSGGASDAVKCAQARGVCLSYPQQGKTPINDNGENWCGQDQECYPIAG